MKLLTFAVPCYNSAAYMSHCIDTLLTGGEEVEIILVNDGSSDETAEIADRYAAEHPSIIRVIHQPNGGHGEGVNQGIRNARGVYYKVVDSDDWVDVPALQQVLSTLRTWVDQGNLIDLLICNYVYEHVLDNTSRTIRYIKVFPENTVFGWKDVGHWSPSEYLLMHSVFYRTALLRECGLELPKHTFYVDYIFVYQPLPYVKTMYYMDLDFYRYFIGRQDQSVNESVMVKRVDQQVRVTKIMLRCCDVMALRESNRKLYRYMCRYLSMMMSISSIFLIISGTEENLAKKNELWQYLKETDAHLYRKLKYRSLSMVTNLPGYQGRKLSVSIYHLAQKIYKFN